MKDILLIIGFVAVWYVLNRWVLPKMGVHVITSYSIHYTKLYERVRVVPAVAGRDAEARQPAGAGTAELPPGRDAAPIEGLEVGAGHLVHRRVAEQTRREGGLDLGLAAALTHRQGEPPPRQDHVVAGPQVAPLGLRLVDPCAQGVGLEPDAVALAQVGEAQQFSYNFV